MCEPNVGYVWACWSFVNPLSLGAGGEGLIYFKHIWRGGLNRDGPGEREGLIQFTKDGGISSPKRTRTQSGKAQVKEVGGHAAEVQTQIRTPSWWKKHPGSIHTKLYRTTYSGDWSMAHSIIYEWTITGGGLKREGVLFTFFYWEREEGLVRERRLRQTNSCLSPKWNNQT